MSFDRMVTVSPIGVSTTGVFVPNNGADFGPDTLGTSTSGIQEALIFAANSGVTGPPAQPQISKVVLLEGTFKVSSQILWPANSTSGNAWCGILEGQGSQPGGSGTFSTLGTTVTSTGSLNSGSLLTLQGSYPTGGQVTQWYQIKDIRFVGASGDTYSVALVDLQQHDNSHYPILWNVIADVTAVSSPPQYAIDFSGSQIGVLYQCQCHGGALKWYTPFGSVRIIGGVYGKGMNIIFQGAFLYGVRTQVISVDPGSGTYVQQAVNSLVLVGCKRASDADSILINTSGVRIWVSAAGGEFTCNSSGSFFGTGGSSASSSPISLSLEGVSLYNVGSSTMYIFDAVCTSHYLQVSAGVNLQGPTALFNQGGSPGPAQTGVGIANQVISGLEVAWTGSKTYICGGSTGVVVDPNVDTLVRVDVAVSSSATDTVTIEVNYSDPFLLAYRTVQMLSGVGINSTTPKSASGIFCVQKNGTIQVHIQTASSTATKASAVVSRMI
jgi:hypothetical protein